MTIFRPPSYDSRYNSDEYEQVNVNFKQRKIILVTSNDKVWLILEDGTDDLKLNIDHNLHQKLLIFKKKEKIYKPFKCTIKNHYDLITFYGFDFLIFLRKYQYDFYFSSQEYQEEALYSLN